jgi:hypothetical protein
LFGGLSQLHCLHGRFCDPAGQDAGPVLHDVPSSNAKHGHCRTKTSEHIKKRFCALIYLIVEVFALLGSYAAYVCSCLPTFLDSIRQSHGQGRRPRLYRGEASNIACSNVACFFLFSHSVCRTFSVYSRPSATLEFRMTRSSITALRQN